MTVAVIGQVARDLVLRCDGLPTSGGSVPVTERREVLGGKGANQAVALAQLGSPSALVGVVGDDAAGATVVRQAADDGIDVAAVARRGDTALLVDLVDAPGSRRLFEHVPPSSLVTVDDLDSAADVLETADTISLQLQQPPATMLEAARRARGARVVADGRPDETVAEELLRAVHVLRMDAAEAEQFAGAPVPDISAVAALADRLLESGPRLVALAVPDAGDLMAWRGGSQFFPHSDAPVVDPTGAGDAFTAGLIAALRRGADPVQAGRAAAAAAGATVQRLGGRPELRDLAPR